MRQRHRGSGGQAERAGAAQERAEEEHPRGGGADWIERYRGLWDASLTRLDAHLAAIQAADEATDRPADDPREPG